MRTGRSSPIADISFYDHDMIFVVLLFTKPTMVKCHRRSGNRRPTPPSRRQIFAGGTLSCWAVAQEFNVFSYNLLNARNIPTELLSEIR